MSSSDSSEYVLYSTPGCHLCELAVELLNPLQSAFNLDIQTIDIATSESLVDQYGIRIPVLLHRQTSQELGWPFDTEQASQFFQRTRN